ncbi:SDR family oxidoreductase [Streptomyces sp. NPDC015032]|uniref:SDR family oxidoreductase n=1 Tax=Streptomyces sp. NPDC015032 TaxID=3364937 RepID=UPI0036FE97D7
MAARTSCSAPDGASREDHDRPVRVNAVRSGPARTQGTAGMGEEGLAALAARAAAGRPAEPEEIAEAIAYPRRGLAAQAPV